TVCRKYKCYLDRLFLLYIIFCVTSIRWLEHANSCDPWKYVMAIIPVLPALFIPVLVGKSIREMDELQRKIQFEALAFGFSATAVLSLGYGFLGNAGIPQLNWVWVWPLMGICWGGGLLLARRRYS